MTALFVLHESKFIYGANRSITELLKNIDYEFDILICKSFTRRINETEIRKLCGQGLRKIYVCWLPRYRCFYFDKKDFISEVSHYVNNIMAFIFQIKRKRIIRYGDYDYIHLNSIVLFPVIDKDSTFIIHVREIFDPSYYNIEKLKKKMDEASGIIYIDEAAKMSLRQVYTEDKSVVLNNPFNMLSVKNVDYMESALKYGISTDDTVFAMLGHVSESKGSKFVISSFMKQKNEKSKLLIVGDYDSPYGMECKEIAKKDKRIIFSGELKDTREIYRISDYVIIGDAQFCTGRTVFESLYSGGGVIIPGEKSDLASFPEGKRFEERILFYTPRNEKELSYLFEKKSPIGQEERMLYSNVDDYIESYRQYVAKVIEKGEGLL